MKEIINSKDVLDFLQDFRDNSVIEILEEGKEKDEIFEIAEARGIKLKGSKDLAGLKLIYTFPDIANKNNARLPKKELLRALPSIVGKPLDVDHDRRYVIGHFLDYRYIVKDDMVVAYAVVYKSNFADEWDTAKKLFKAGKLATSYEIWSDKNKRKNLTDGTYELHDMTIAGGAILFKTKPAFEDAKVLEIAKKSLEQSEELVFASEYKDDDIIVAKDETVATVPPTETTTSKSRYITEEELKSFKLPDNMELIKTDKGTLIRPKEEKKPEAPKVDEKPKIKCSHCGAEIDYLSLKEKGMGYAECPSCHKNIDQTGKAFISKIKCANCQHEFEAPKVPTSEIKCSECFAIINERGELLYPPQIIDFHISCPSCNSSNWRLLKKDDSTGKIKCLSCAKAYDIEFAKTEINENLDKFQFLHIGQLSCKQCGTYITYSGSSKMKKYNLKCAKCGLQFTHDITHEQIKKLTKITEVIVEPIKASEEITSKADELNKDISATKIEEAKGEPKMEKPEVSKPVETKAEEAPKVETTPQAESVVAEAKPVEAKIEETPKVEKKKETPKPEEPKPEEKPIEEAKKEETEEEKKMKKYKIVVRKYANKIRTMRKEKASLIKSSEDRVKFYIANAEEINKRRKELGEAGLELADVDLLDDKKFSDVKLEKVNKNLEAGSIVGTKVHENDEEWYAKKRKEISDKAEGKIKRSNTL